MSRLFESFEKLDAENPYRHNSPRNSFGSAILCAFMAGMEAISIFAMVDPLQHPTRLWSEVAFLAVCLVVGVYEGRIAWERVSS